VPKTSRLLGPSKADGTQAPVLEQRAYDVELTGPNSDLTIGGDLTVAGVSLDPVELADLPEITTPLDGAELVPVEQDGVAVQATTADLAGGPVETMAGVARTRIRYADDLEQFTAAVTADATLIVGTKIRSALSGTGAQIAQGQALSEYGIADVSTGTTTTGRCAIVPVYPLLPLFVNTELYRMGARVKLPAASDGTNTYQVTIGFGDMTSAAPADGILFRSPTAAGNWSALIRDDSADLDVTDTGVAADFAGSFHVFVVEYDPDFSGVRWYIDGTVVASETVNEPDALANLANWGVGIFKSAGTTARIVEVDCISWPAMS
jgi:hypothetical protein